MEQIDGASPGGEIVVRRAGSGDLEALVRFNCGIALETEGLALDPDVLRAGLARVLADRALGFYTVAEVGGSVAGCMLITFEWSDWRNGMIWWIQSVYVAREARERGVFSALFARVDREARATPGVLGFRLYVDEGNERAQAVYLRRGLSPTRYRVFESLDDRPC